MAGQAAGSRTTAQLRLSLTVLDRCTLQVEPARQHVTTRCSDGVALAVSAPGHPLPAGHASTSLPVPDDDRGSRGVAIVF